MQLRVSKMPLNWIIALLIIVMVTSLSTKAQEHHGSPCQFCYVLQPPGAIESCNPHGASYIRLVCQVEGPAGATLDIKWYFESSDDDTPSNKTEIGKGIPPHYSSIIKIKQLFDSNTKQLLTSRLTIHNLMIGDYWCQVYHEDMGLLESEKMGIGGESDYSREDDCKVGQVFNKTIEKCADIPIPAYTADRSGTSSSTCPLTLIRSSTSLISNSSTIPTTSYNPTSMIVDYSNTIIAASSTIRTHSRYSVPSESIPGSSRLVVPIASNSPSSDSTVLNDAKQAQTWLFVVVGLSGVFLVLIIVLVVVFALLCVTGPTNTQKRPNDLNLRNRLDTITSPVTTDPPSRPLTSMTLQTDIPTTVSHEANKLIAGYNPLDQDYEDIDDDDDMDETMMSNPRYHEQGPTIVGSSNISIAITPGGLTQQPLYTIPTDVGYSEIGTPTEGSGGPNPSHGYGKLDHSTRPRQTYNPRINSPLLSGYRKLDHVHVSSGSTSGTTTLPNQASLAMKSPGYANISVPTGASGGGPHHIRSISLPSSEYSNLNHNSNNNQSTTSPTTPLPSTPAAVTPTSKKYANFAIIEALDEEDGDSDKDQQVRHASVSRHGSEDYQMLSEATTIDRTDPPNMKEEYEFLPICVCEDEQGSLPPQSPSGSQYGGRSSEGLMRRHIESSLGRDLVEEKMSINSHCSSDFTGPFFFPHMSNFDGQSEDRHVYRALELSTMEPSKGYTSVKIKEESN